MPLYPNRSSHCLVPGGCFCPRGLGAQVRCPKQPSSCWRRASCSSCPAQDCPQPHEGPPWLDDDLSARCLMAQAVWLAWRAPSISLETRSLGTGIDAAGSLNINASLGSGNQGEGGGREAVAAGRAFLPLLCRHTRRGGTRLGCAQPRMGGTVLGQHEAFRVLLRAGKNKAWGKPTCPGHRASSLTC